jgi:hypothetical protein
MDPLDRINLNIPPPKGPPIQRNHWCVGDSGDIEVVFRDHKPRLLRLFAEEVQPEMLACLGAMAWFTDFEVLDAMTSVPSSVLVQKEDFLRLDGDPAEAGVRRDGWRDILRDHYVAIAESDIHQPGFCRQNFPSPLGDMALTGDQAIAGVRCVGVRNQRGRRAQPLMHHKFLLFAKLSFLPEPGHEGEHDPLLIPHWDPRIVWTGSANLTRLTHRSRENSLIIRDPKIAAAYLDEWVDLMTLSEPLDWDSDGVDPEWRLGS